MTSSKIKSIIGLAIIGTWSGSILLILLLMVFNVLDVNKGQEILKTFSSVSSGFVGLIVGYYFTHWNDSPNE